MLGHTGNSSGFQSFSIRLHVINIKCLILFCTVFVKSKLNTTTFICHVSLENIRSTAYSGHAFSHGNRRWEAKQTVAHNFPISRTLLNLKVLSLSL